MIAKILQSTDEGPRAARPTPGCAEQVSIMVLRGSGPIVPKIMQKITHPLDASGTHPDGTTKIGRWWDINRHQEGLNVHSRWGAKKSKHSNNFHHGFFTVPLVASTFGHLHPDFLRFLWNFSQVDRNHPALFDLYRTGEVRHGDCSTDATRQPKSKRPFFLNSRLESPPL